MGYSMHVMDLADILAARRAIQPHVWRTPLIRSAGLSQIARGDVWLKLECWQRTGSFKLRGAVSKLASLSSEERAAEVVTASAGNHGLGVAYAAQALGLPSVVIFVPETTPLSKLEKLQAWASGSRSWHVQVAGADYDACHALSADYARDRGATYVSAYDDLTVIAGQGTVGLEIMEELPDADLLLVPVGGGGLIAGTATAAHAVRPSVRVIGLQPEASPAAYLSLRDGRPYETYPAGPTLCDGLAGGFGRVPFELARHLIDDVLVLPEPDIREAIAWLAAHEQLLVEGAGAIAIAPLLSGRLAIEGKQVAAILTGRHLDAAVLRSILQETKV